jgi:1-acyl-sn-glycerol-3-phosphate acyltransferase
LQAVTPEASLVADVGLGSLERVELGIRLEQAFGVPLGEEALGLDTAIALARAARKARAAEPSPGPAQEGPPPPAPLDRARTASTLQEALHTWADAEPIRPHVYVQEEVGPATTLTYGQLWERAADIAGGIIERNVPPGEAVALMLPTGVDFLSAFMGILVAGGIPVPLYPPAGPARMEEYLLRQTGILENAATRLLITSPRVIPVARVLRGTLGSSLHLTTAEELARRGEAVSTVSGSSTDPALIQYTSGSTGAPKGVLLSHAAILANIQAIGAHVGLRPGDVAVSWLPLYHDMGLIGSWLGCLYHGVPLALMSPLAFLARPDRWLWAIHRYRATLSAAPNFGYELCVGRIPDERLEGLDLSSWRCALNGAEPVSADTLDRFCQRFGRFGFRAQALMPAYGLAESAVALCLSPLERGPVVDRISRAEFEGAGQARPAPTPEASPIRFVSMGPPLPGHEVMIVDEGGEQLPDRRIGRLLFRGPSTMTGYFRRPEATEEVSFPGGWVETGDLAYVTGGELHVTGRRKDLVIKAGRNLVPEEIEAAASRVEGVRKGCVAAFGVMDPRAATERLVVVAETRATGQEELRDLETAVIRSVAEAIDLPPDRVVLVPPGSVPKTSSGKIRRSTAREWFQAGRIGTQEHPPLRMALELLRARTARAAMSFWLATRRAAYLAYLAVCLPVALVLCALPAWGLTALLPGRRAAVILGRLVCRITLRIVGIRVSVEGLEHLPERRAVIVAANHSSYLDALVLLAHLPRDASIVTKREVLQWPIVGTFVRKADYPTVDRWEFRRSVADSRAIARRLGTGEAVLFFPEGTFVSAAGLRPFRLGAFEIAGETDVPVLPVAIAGTRRALRPGRRLPRPGHVRVWIGPAIAPEGEGWPAVIRLRDRTFDAIAAKCGEPKMEIVAGGPVARSFRPRGGS